MQYVHSFSFTNICQKGPKNWCTCKAALNQFYVFYQEKAKTQQEVRGSEEKYTKMLKVGTSKVT